jgi:transposase
MKAQDLVPNIIVADSKFFCEKTITKAQSEGLLWVTRVPETCGDVAFNINKAISARNQWIKMTEENGEKPASGLCYQEFTVDLFGMLRIFMRPLPEHEKKAPNFRRPHKYSLNKASNRHIFG